MINRVVLVGRLVRDPEKKQTNSETQVVNFTVAIDNRGKGADGQRTSSFIPVVVFGDQANNVSKYCHKGSLVGVDGRLQQRSFERKDGTKASVIEVIADSVRFLEPKGAKENSDVPSVEEPKHVEAPKNEEKLEDTEMADDDLPF